MQLPKGIIFDADGTLLDSMMIWENAGARYLATLGIKAEPGLDHIVFPMTMDESCSYIKEHYHLPQGASEILSGIHQAVHNFYYYEAPLKPGAGQLLDLLSQRKIPMTIATTSEREHIEAAFTRLGIMDKFQGIFTASEVGCGKHSPDIYLACAGALRLPPEHIWVFEDVCYALETAARAGFHTVGVYDRTSSLFQQPVEGAAEQYTIDYSNIIEQFAAACGLRAARSNDS